MLGLGINHISQRKSRRTVAIVGVAITGFIIGSGYYAIQQNKPEEEKLEEQNGHKIKY